MTSLITDEIKYQLFNAIYTMITENFLETDDVEQNKMMEQIIIDNPCVFISYGLLYNVVNSPDFHVNNNIRVELLEYAWKQLIDDTFNTEFHNYFWYLSVMHLK
jgi:hypothetical protein